MELEVVAADGSVLAEVTATELRDRDDRRILAVIEQTTAPEARRQGLMALIELYLLHRTGAELVHHLAPTDSSAAYAEGMVRRGVYAEVDASSADLLAVRVDRVRVGDLVAAQPG